MGFASLPWKPVDGDKFTKSGIASDLCSTGSEGLYTEGNGGLDADNFVPLHQFDAAHILPDEANLHRFAETKETMDYIGNFAHVVDQTTFFNTPIGISFYMPYSGIAIVTLQVAVHNWRHISGGNEEDNPDGTAFKLSLRLSHNGTTVPNTERQMPKNIFRETFGSGPTNVKSEYESATSHMYTMHCKLTVLPGYHNVILQGHIQSAERDIELKSYRGYLGSWIVAPPTHPIFDAYNRFTLGTSGTSVLALS